MRKKDSGNQSADMRRKILDAAGELMIEKGVVETSLKDIAKKAGMSAGTLYYYYSAKEDIIYDMADQNLKQITDGLLNWIDGINAETSRERILTTVFEKILAAETRGKLHLHLISEAGTANGALKQKYAERYAEWRSMLQLGIDKVIRQSGPDCDAFAHLILAALDGLIIQKMFAKEPVPVDGVVRLIVRSYP